MINLQFTIMFLEWQAWCYKGYLFSNFCLINKDHVSTLKRKNNHLNKCINLFPSQLNSWIELVEALADIPLRLS